MWDVSRCLFWIFCLAIEGSFHVTRIVWKVKIHHVKADREIFYAYCGNTAVDLDPLPVSRARLTVVEPALFE
jgi:hypothetical protein